MGYSYDMRGRLACDSCGRTGETRKRPCPHKVTTETGQVLRYCQAPALCGDCLRKHGGTAGVHAGCKEGAAKSQARYDARRERLAAGEAQVMCAWGDWHELVPTGLVGALFIGADKVEHCVLLRVQDYDPSTKPWLSDYPDAMPWENHPGATSKAVYS